MDVKDMLENMVIILSIIAQTLWRFYFPYSLYSLISVQSCSFLYHINKAVVGSIRLSSFKGFKDIWHFQGIHLPFALENKTKYTIIQMRHTGTKYTSIEKNVHSAAVLLRDEWPLWFLSSWCHASLNSQFLVGFDDIPSWGDLWIDVKGGTSCEFLLCGWIEAKGSGV